VTHQQLFDEWILSEEVNGALSQVVRREGRSHWSQPGATKQARPSRER
jgi:hypothetical protein